MAPLAERRSETEQLPRKTWRLASEPICQYLRSAKHTQQDKGLAAALATQGFWTRSRLVRAGLAIDVLCPLCSLRPDTVHHRLYGCEHPDAAAIRTRVLKPWQLEEARQAGETSALWTKGWMEHPTQEWPEALECDERVLQAVNEAGEWEDVDPGDTATFDLQGLVYEDGSADVHVISELRRAGWGLVQVGPTGAALKRAYGPVPRDLPQTAYIAEWCGYSEVSQLAQGPTQPHQDCLNAVKAFLKPVQSQLRCSNKAADFLPRGPETSVRRGGAERCSLEPGLGNRAAQDSLA